MLLSKYQSRSVSGSSCDLPDFTCFVFIPIFSSGKRKRRNQDRSYQRLDCASLLQAHVLHDKAVCVRYLVFSYIIGEKAYCFDTGENIF
jgi:hypothetical protein